MLQWRSPHDIYCQPISNCSNYDQYWSNYNLNQPGNFCIGPFKSLFNKRGLCCSIKWVWKFGEADSRIIKVHCYVHFRNSKTNVFVFFFFGKCLSALQMKSWIRICLPIYTLNELSFQERARQDYCSEILFANMKIRYLAGKSTQCCREVNEIVMSIEFSLNVLNVQRIQWQKYLSLQ